MIRLYFNQRGPEPWTLDQGPAGTKLNLSNSDANALLQHFGVEVKTNLSESNPELEPTAWVEFTRFPGVPA